MEHLTRLIRFSIVAVCALLTLFGVSSAFAEEKTLDIGMIFSLSGPAAPFGIPERDAAEIVAKDINDKGGVNGRAIRLHIFDDATNPTETARGVTQLVQKNKVVAILGATTGSGTLAAAPVAMRYEVPMLAPNGTVDIVDKGNRFYPWVFRSTTNDVINAQKMLDAFVSDGAKKLAILHEENAYGKAASDYIHEVAAKSGVTIVETVGAASKAIDLTSQATKIRNAGVDGVLMQVSSPALGGAFVRAAKQVGLNSPIIGPIGLGQKAFIEAAGDAGEGVRLVVVANWDAPAPEMEELGKLLVAADKPPRGFGELMATNGLLAVVAAAKSLHTEPTGKAIRDALENVCGLQTYSTGKLCYSADNHDGWGEDVPLLVEIRNGKFLPK